jgi:hypothetical protein
MIFPNVILSEIAKSNLVKIIFNKKITKDKNTIKIKKTNKFFKYIFIISLNFKTNHQSKNENNTITNKNKLIENQNSKLVNSHLICDTK